MSKKRKTSTRQVSNARKVRKVSSMIVDEISSDPHYQWKELDLSSHIYDIPRHEGPLNFPIFINEFRTGRQITLLQLFLRFVPDDLITLILKDLIQERPAIWHSKGQQYANITVTVIYRALAIAIRVYGIAYRPSGRHGDEPCGARPLRAALAEAVGHFSAMYPDDRVARPNHESFPGVTYLEIILPNFLFWNKYHDK